jgi:SAM-dependent methyltransferase
MTVWNDEQHARDLARSTWMASVAVLMHLNERATGDPAHDWLSSWAHRWFVGDSLRVLVLGCGEGWLERAIAEWPFVARIDAVDFAEEAVARAREASRGIEKIHYGVVDLNRDELPPDTYDVVLAHSVLHHVANLEHAYAQIERTMRAHATLIVNEYAGPKRFQYSDDVDAILHTLNDCLGTPHRPRPTVDEMIAHDPTEAVRSDELLAFTERHFDVLERKRIGGTILQHLLFGIVSNFAFEDARQRSIIDILCVIEGMLIDANRIPCDYVILAARKRGASVTREDRPLPPRPPAAMDVEPDPLSQIAGATRSENARTPALRCLRLALLAQQARRANLFEEDFALADDSWDAVLALAPDDAVLRCLLRTAATLAAREDRRADP